LLAELAAGSSFGEEALVSGAQRNATITMISDGELICLAKNDFDELLKAPIVKTVSFSDAEQMVANGAIWLDVRLKSEFDNNGLPDSMNAPLPQLRNRIRGLQRDKKYIIYCDTGRRSASAAYLLSERNIDTYVLEGGLVNINRTPAQNN
ncbi:cyclic nucleotide-binding domain-containing protein, partial [Candidatus Pacearchaeota archaeon]|nr:cyclic nucleotide-binding domain-containing protein [Candidatus Pacearchaeota archaeon]